MHGGGSDGDPDVHLDPERPATGVYLCQFDLYRCVACAGVVAQHAVLWPVPGGSVGGWSLVMVLHATRESFFFLSALLATYSLQVRPRPVVALWWRRIGAVLVPYLVWTAIYFAYTMATTARPAGGALGTLGHDVTYGYYQLYFLVVLFQFFLLLPALWWFVRVTRRHHWLVLGASAALQLAMMSVHHYAHWQSGALGTIAHVNATLITSRCIVGYQLYLVGGVLAAAHLGELQRFVEWHTRGILVVAVAAGLGAEAYYAYGVAIGQPPGRASDLFQPVAVVWFAAAIAGLTALGVRWARRADGGSGARASGRASSGASGRASSGASGEGRRRDRLVTWGSDVSGGIYLSHVLVLQLVLSGLGAVGLRTAAPWGWVSLTLFVLTVGLSAALVTLLLRTPLRWVLTGPNRTAQRARLPLYSGRRSPADDPVSASRAAATT